MKYFLILLLISFQVNAIELTYDLLKINVPKDELKGAGSYKGDFVIIGKPKDNWSMVLTNKRFQVDCIVVQPYAHQDCSLDKRFEMIEYAINHPNEKTFLDIFLIKGWIKKYIIEKKEYDETISYFMIENNISPTYLKKSVIINVNKKTFKTFLIEGNFNQREAQWFEFP